MTTTSNAPQLAQALRVQIELGYPGGFRLRADQAFPPGITCLLGPSGAGKSSLLTAIAGLVMPAHGSIALGPKTWFERQPGQAPTTNLPIELRRVAFVFQRLALFPHLTGLANTRYGLTGTMPRAEQDAQALRWMQRLGVAHLAHRKPGSFSGGEAQRVALARALAISPTLMLFDEPFSSLDAALRTDLIGLVRDIAREVRVPMLFVTHSTREATALGERLLYVDQGAISDTLRD